MSSKSTCPMILISISFVINIFTFTKAITALQLGWVTSTSTIPRFMIGTFSLTALEECTWGMLNTPQHHERHQLISIVANLFSLISYYIYSVNLILILISSLTGPRNMIMFKTILLLSYKEFEPSAHSN